MLKVFDYAKIRIRAIFPEYVYAYIYILFLDFQDS
jgi:hypothetical protein